MRLLQHVLSAVLQHNLIRMDLSTVIGDMMQVGEAAGTTGVLHPRLSARRARSSMIPGYFLA